jgi:hypothetical protein
VVNKAAVLEEREKAFELDTSKPFKLNAGTVGVCEFTRPSFHDQPKAEFRTNLLQIEFFTLLSAWPRLQRKQSSRKAPVFSHLMIVLGWCMMQ